MLKNKDSTIKSENIIDSKKGNAYDDIDVAKNIDVGENDETPRNSSYIGHIAKQTLGIFTGNNENENKEGNKNTHDIENNQKLKNTNDHFDSTDNAAHSNYTYTSMVDPVIDKNDVVQSERRVHEIKQQMKTGEYDSIKNHEKENENNQNRKAESHANPTELKHGDSKSSGSGSDSRTNTESHSGSGSGHGLLKKLGIHRKSKSESGSDKKSTGQNDNSQNDVDASAGNSSDQYFEPAHKVNVDDSYGDRKQDIAETPGDSYDNKNQSTETSKNDNKSQDIQSPNDIYGNKELETPGNTYKTGFESSVNKKRDRDVEVSRDTSDNPHHTPLDEFAMKDQYAKQHEKNIKDKQKGEIVDADDYLNPAPVCKNTASGADLDKASSKNLDKNSVAKENFNQGAIHNSNRFNQKDLDDQPLAPVLESLKLNESKEASGYTDELSNPHRNDTDKKDTEYVTNSATKRGSGNEFENENENENEHENQGILGTIYGYLGMQNDQNGEGQIVNPDNLETNIPGSYYDYENTDNNVIDKNGGELENSDAYAMRAGDNSRMDPMKHDKLAGAVGESTPYRYIQSPSDDNYLVSENAQDLKTSKNRNVPLVAGAAAGAATGTAILKTNTNYNHHPTVETVIDKDAKRYVGRDATNPTKNDMLSGATVESTPYRMVQDPNHKKYLQTKNANLLKSRKGVNDSHIGASDMVNKDIKSKGYSNMKRDTVSDPAHYISEGDSNIFLRDPFKESELSGINKSSGSTDDYYQGLANKERGEENNEFNSKKVTDNKDIPSDYDTENKKDETWLAYILGRGSNNNTEEPSNFATKTSDYDDYKVNKTEMTYAEAGAGDGLGAGIGTIGLGINGNSNIGDQGISRDDNALDDEQPLFKKSPAGYKENPQYGLQEHVIGSDENNQKDIGIRPLGSDGLPYSDKIHHLNYKTDPEESGNTIKSDHISGAVTGAGVSTLASGSYNAHLGDTQLNQSIATDVKTKDNNQYVGGNGVTDKTTNQIKDASLPAGDYQRKDAGIIGNQSNVGGNNGHDQNMQYSRNEANQKANPIKSQDSDHRRHKKSSSGGSGKNKLMALFGKDNKNNADAQNIEKTPIKTRGTKYGVIHDEGAKALEESIKSPSATNKVSNDEYDDLAGGAQLGRKKSWIEKIKDKVT